MKRSESHEYMNYGRALGYGNNRKALEWFLRFVENNNSEFSDEEMCDALFCIGGCYFKLGRVELAKFYYRSGVVFGKDYMGRVLEYARFIGKDMMNKGDAIRICDDVIARCRANAEDMAASKNLYVSMANDLKADLAR